MKINFFNIVGYYQFMIENIVNDAMVAVDCTAGNGNDTLFLCNIMKGRGKVFAFDVQEEAVRATTELLEAKCPYDNYEVINDCHSKIGDFIDGHIDFALFNLGYLPNSKSRVSTTFDTTLKSVEACLKSLRKKGYIFIAAYLGHDNSKERNSLFDYLSKLDSKKYKVANHRLININNYPPELFIIQKMHDIF
jgi:tRNA G37 N-methylase Trm5